MPVPTFVLATYGDTGYLLGHFVRDQGALSLEAAIKKITADTARIWGPGRGCSWPRALQGTQAIFDAKEIDRCAEEARFDMLKRVCATFALPRAWWACL